MWVPFRKGSVLFFGVFLIHLTKLTGFFEVSLYYKGEQFGVGVITSWGLQRHFPELQSFHYVWSFKDKLFNSQ